MNTLKNLHQNRYILGELIRKRVTTQYRNSILGMFWTILNPLLNMLVMWLIFSQFFERDINNYPLYLLTGNILFSCFRNATDGSLQSLVNNSGLLKRVKIDSYLFPLSTTLSSVVTFSFSMIALIVIMLGMQLFGGQQIFNIRMLAVFLMVPAFVLFEYGISLFLSAIYVFCRDIKYIYSVFLTLLHYITPIFYNLDRFDSSSLAVQVVKLNPLYYFLRFFRDCMYRGWGEYFLQDLLVLYALGIISVIIGVVVYKPLKKHFMMYI